MSVNLLTLVDTAMVGSLGNAALAAVGLGSFLSTLIGAPFQGVATAVHAMVSRRFGAGQRNQTLVCLRGGLVLSLVIGLPISIGGYFLAGWFYSVLVADPAVWAEGTPYFQIVALSTFLQGINFAFRCFWNGTQRPTAYMNALFLMFLSNILLNYMFIFGHWGAPELGTAGAGVGTTGSVIFGNIYYWLMHFREKKRLGSGIPRPNKALFVRLIRLGFPAGIQEIAFMGCYMVLLYFVGLIGTAELAAANVLIRLMTLGYLPAIGFAIAAATLVGEALGKKDPEDAARWCWDVNLVAVTGLTLCGLPLVFFPDPVLAIFIHDAHTLDLARSPLRLTGLFLGLTAMGPIFIRSLISAGDAKRTMIVCTSLQWLFFLPMVWLIGVNQGFGLLGVWIVQCGFFLVMILCLIVLWHGGRWKAVDI